MTTTTTTAGEEKNKVARVEELSECEVRLHFTNGTTMRMARKAYERGNWKRGTSLGLVLPLVRF